MFELELLLLTNTPQIYIIIILILKKEIQLYASDI